MVHNYVSFFRSMYSKMVFHSMLLLGHQLLKDRVSARSNSLFNVSLYFLSIYYDYCCNDVYYYITIIIVITITITTITITTIVNVIVS